jgi:GNAT superfamily N-acetyltransferase
VNFRIREVDTSRDDVQLKLSLLQDIAPEFPRADVDAGHWWVAEHDGFWVGYATMVKSTHYNNAGYFSRVAVRPTYRGHGLQRRLMRAIEMRARKNGWTRMVSDTTDAVFSANNFIRQGYRVFDPRHPWAFANSIYWTKDLS